MRLGCPPGQHHVDAPHAQNMQWHVAGRRRCLPLPAWGHDRTHTPACPHQTPLTRPLLWHHGSANGPTVGRARHLCQASNSASPEPEDPGRAHREHEALLKQLAQLQSHMDTLKKRNQQLRAALGSAQGKHTHAPQFKFLAGFACLHAHSMPMPCAWGST